MNPQPPIGRPDTSEYGPFSAAYIALVQENDIVQAMRDQLAQLVSFLSPLSEALGNTRHPPYTWSVKEVLGHITDTERIFAYRALRFARADATPLPGFDENQYSAAAQFDRFTLASLLEQFQATRAASLAMFENFPPEAWDRRGPANNSTMTVRALAYAIVGHTRHHERILRQRLGR